MVSRGGQVPDPLQTFDSVGFSPEIMREIQRAGYAAPTPIQAQSWAVALRGSDLISIAKTGSGKTCGFLLPGFMHCAATRRDPRVGPTMAVLAPTRELAVQIKEEADKFGRSGGFRNTCCYGASMERSLLEFFFSRLDLGGEASKQKAKNKKLTFFRLLRPPFHPSLPPKIIENSSSSPPPQAAPPRARSSATSASASSSSSRPRGASTTSSRAAWSGCTRSRTSSWTRRTACSTWASSRRSSGSCGRSRRSGRRCSSRRRGRGR